MAAHLPDIQVSTWSLWSIKRGCPQSARHRTPLDLQEVYVETGSGRAGGPWTPTRCLETQVAECAETAEGACSASVHTVVVVTDRRRYHFLYAWSALTGGERPDPVHRAGDLATPVNDRSSLPQGSSGRLLAPTRMAQRRPQLRAAGTLPSYCSVHDVRSSQRLRPSARRHCAITGPQIRELLPARTRHTQSRPSWDGRPRGGREMVPSSFTVGICRSRPGSAPAVSLTGAGRALGGPEPQVEPVMLNQQDRALCRTTRQNSVAAQTTASPVTSTPASLLFPLPASWAGPRGTAQAPRSGYASAQPPHYCVDEYDGSIPARGSSQPLDVQVAALQSLTEAGAPDALALRAVGGAPRVSS